MAHSIEGSGVGAVAAATGLSRTKSKRQANAQNGPEAFGPEHDRQAKHEAEPNNHGAAQKDGRIPRQEPVILNEPEVGRE